MKNNRLSGSMPDPGAMTSLRAIDVSENSLSGALPAGIALLDSLESFVGSMNLFSGPLPDAFGTLLNLQTLQLGENALTGNPSATFFGSQSLLDIDLVTTVWRDS